MARHMMKLIWILVKCDVGVQACKQGWPCFLSFGLAANSTLPSIRHVRCPEPLPNQNDRRMQKRYMKDM